ncbi:hypothetical protein WHR41_05091 [Cladosporium halotolerans]|uniref:tRNA (uracil-O(2)-)-methyltransferase n=1 Tax=Cladosporium halotolerans TaxID=1052096 RepID=A0AB34KPP7_9PEZI
MAIPCNDSDRAVTSTQAQPNPPASTDPSKFEAVDRSKTTPDIKLPNESWLTVLQSSCTYGPPIFERIMLNFIKNPNVTSSHLFRADILFDSDSQPQNGHAEPSDANSRPRDFELPGWTRNRVMVRLLVPRNQQLDRPMTQTCILLSRKSETDLEEHMVVYIPHIDTPDEMPFYHPRVNKLAFHHTFRPSPDQPPANPNDPEQSIPGAGSLSVSYNPFDPTAYLEPKLHRTALKLLQTIHKHGQGQLVGYEKRVHLDRVIPQKRYQDTYARLKTKYGRKLIDGWVEVTDPGKHVFEDLGIAAFCLELWRTMYEVPAAAREEETVGGAETSAVESNLDDPSLTSNGANKPPFPGFVDIGCGNGLLTHILISEGYPGYGFDARERKSWSTFPDAVQQNLHQSLLVPSLLRSSNDHPSPDNDSYNSGLFAPGTFIISNHADELTAWTPLLAYLNSSAFLAIPCCSHDLAGSRFRAPDSTKAQKARRNEHAARLPQQEEASPDESAVRQRQAAETGSLKRTLVHKKMASAYSTLCAYVEALADAVGCEAEREVLRIPSTRNQSIIGRKWRGEGKTEEEKAERVRRLVEEELGRGIEDVGREWLERAEKLAKKPSSGH